MSDILRALNSNPITAPIVKMLGLPQPVELWRSDGGYQAKPFQGKAAVLLDSREGFALRALDQALREFGASVIGELAEESKDRADIVVMDATGCVAPADYRALYDGFHPLVRKIAPNGRVLIVAASPSEAESPVSAAVARGMEGFTRSLGKELGKYGTTVNLAHVERSAADRLHGIVHFFCGPQTAYVSGQVVHVTSAVAAPASVPVERVLQDKVAVVTGGARGIGLATAQRLAQEGACVVCIDIPAMQEDLRRAVESFGAVPLTLDIATPEAPAQLARFLKDRFSGVDIMVHNAGITRDRTLANMPGHHWDQVIGVNLAAIVALDEELLRSRLLRDGGRIVCLSSISGVAGNYGQTSYGATKAALIGYAAARAKSLAGSGICINAVAPGFIETAMTDAMPFATREIGRRMNSVKQGGVPRDVGELITFLASPGAYGLTGNVIRVCGQGLIGA